MSERARHRVTDRAVAAVFDLRQCHLGDFPGFKRGNGYERRACA